jgi:hypothetical protein
MSDTAIPPRSTARAASGRGKKGGPKLTPRFVVRLDDTTYDVLRRHSFTTHTPAAQIVREAIRAYLKDQL